MEANILYDPQCKKFCLHSEFWHGFDVAELRSSENLYFLITAGGGNRKGEQGQIWTGQKNWPDKGNVEISS